MLACPIPFVLLRHRLSSADGTLLTTSNVKARIASHNIGLRLWGIVLEPTLPSLNGSSTSSTSVICRVTTSCAILPTVAAIMPSTAANSATPSREVCHAILRDANVQNLHHALLNLKTPLRDRRQSPHRTGELSNQQARFALFQAFAMALHLRQQNRNLKAKRDW